MPIQSWGKSGVLAYFGLKIGYFGHIFLDMELSLDHCLPTNRAGGVDNQMIVKCNVINQVTSYK